MSIIKIPTCFYRQCDADYQLPVPAEGYGGWDKTELDFDIGHSAIVVMHACDCGAYESVTGWYRAVEYLPRANRIAREVFPDLLHAVRSAGIRVFHVAFPGNYYQDLPGYKMAVKLTGSDKSNNNAVAADSVYEGYINFKAENVFPGINNIRDITVGASNKKFYDEALPLDNEGIAENEKQLTALCREYGINHLIYIGFAIDGCLLTSPGGMMDMARAGILCSTIREAVTAIENKETARQQICKQIALWRVAAMFGFVYDLNDFVSAIKST